ncbi:MAG: hypothetical protein A2Y78_13145 [Acidobacteria bacterium RBG_13_68_16]|nr:MAG: hypothetical protein A2Y78_13145 [Acidobacteria bacterium RBG_13_68_16]
MILCPNCGNTLEPNAKVCTRCGQAVPTPAPAGPTSAVKGRGLPVVPLAILGGGVLALVLVLLLVRDNPPAGEVLSGSAAPTPALAAAQQPPTMPAALDQPRVTPTAAPTVVAAPPAIAPPIAVAAAPPPTPTPPIQMAYECREGAIFGVDPEETLVTVNGTTIGTADEWDDAGGGKKYLFGKAGTYYVKLSLQDYRTTWVKIVVRPGAEEEYAEVDLDLEKLED